MALLDVLRLPDPVVLDPNYYVLLESHVAYLVSHPDTETVLVTGQQAEKYTGDLAGLLNSLAIDKKYHYLIARMNGLVSSSDYDGEMTSLLIPSFPVSARFMILYDTHEV